MEDVEIIKAVQFSRVILDAIKETAIGFKEWQDANLEDKGWTQYDGHDRWINPHTREVKSTEQLFDIYLSQSLNK